MSTDDLVILEGLAVHLLAKVGGTVTMDTEDYTLLMGRKIAYYAERGTLHFLLVDRDEAGRLEGAEPP